MSQPTETDARRILEIAYDRERTGTTDDAVDEILTELRRIHDRGRLHGIAYIKPVVVGDHS